MISNYSISYTLAALVVVATIALDSVSITNHHVVDLSKDFVEDEAAMTTSPGAAKIFEVASSDPLMRAALVLEHGKVVARYYRDDVDENGPSQLWSTTNSWMSMLIGMLVDDGVLSIDETLGDTFTDDSAWADVEDGTTDFRKSVTIKEILTMTSGLVPPAGENVLDLLELPPEEIVGRLDSFVESGAASNSGGASLGDSLARPVIGTKGEFGYRGGGNILSYVVKNRTGMTPQEYLSKNVLPKLGFEESEYDWWQNSDAMEYSYFGLGLTALQMAKLPQLYLQGGQYKPSTTISTASDDSQLISKAWVDASIEIYALDKGFFQMGYGYLWWIAAHPGMYCSLGLFGQDSCYDTNTGRVMVQQRDMDEAYPLSISAHLIIPTVAADPELSFAAASDGTNIAASTEEGSRSSSAAVKTPVLTLLPTMIVLIVLVLL